MNRNILETEEAISFVKDTFSSNLSDALGLVRVSSPIMVLDGTGVNDDLNGVERCVTFPVKQMNDQRAVIVNSLAKWKRIRLMELGIEVDRGILTDMRAIRPDEDYSPIHSIYVDQWDWEKNMDPQHRNLATLKAHVNGIYNSILKTESAIADKYSDIAPILPQEIRFIHAEELLQRYPNKSPKERENAVAKEYGAVFIMGIGGPLSNAEIHDGRAPDYDDWSSENEDGYRGLNGDLLVWNPVLNSGLELSSMGIRVDAKSLERQLTMRGDEARKQLFFHQMVLGEKIPQSIGGGIGQSRMCMYLLRKQHIGEVQVSVWPDEVIEQSRTAGIQLL
ncbi:aspartate--ammonia ligase [Membranihabitans marinus]|nr:aspartate--ammonia ligase [Membranihabitans marinus]